MAGKVCFWLLIESFASSLYLISIQLREGPSEGIFVHGVYLWGVGWDKNSMDALDVCPRSTPTQLPVIHVHPVSADSMAKEAGTMPTGGAVTSQSAKLPANHPSVFPCPVYHSQATKSDSPLFTLEFVKHEDRMAIRGAHATLRSFWYPDTLHLLVVCFPLYSVERALLVRVIVPTLIHGWVIWTSLSVELFYCTCYAVGVWTSQFQMTHECHAWWNFISAFFSCEFAILGLDNSLHTRIWALPLRLHDYVHTKLVSLVINFH